MTPRLTEHARIRMQQRGIPAAVLEDLLDYGRVAHDHRGATVLYFDRRARTALRRSGKRHDAYAVVGGDGEIRTVGHRFKRLWRAS
jgi:hypothetical protein